MALAAATIARAQSPGASPAAVPRWEFLPKRPNVPSRHADPRQPQAVIRFIAGDTGIRNRVDGGVGGQAGVFRWSPAVADCALGLDAYASFFAQFDLTHRADLLGFDGQYGFPMAFRWRTLTLSAGFAHTSSHLGDEFAESAGLSRLDYRREELVSAVDWLGPYGLHLYTEVGYGIDLGVRDGPGRQRPLRLQYGFDWEPRGGCWERWPVFAGWNAEHRQEARWTICSHLQLGWRLYSTRLGREIRLTTSWYTGRSLLLQFHDHRTQWWSIAASIEF